MSLPAEVQAAYTVIIDSILAASDLNTISEKRIRKGLQQAIDHDISAQKDIIKPIIMARFDKFMAEINVKPESNGHVKEESTEPAQQPTPPSTKVHTKTEGGDDELSEIPKSPPPKKKRKLSPVEDADAAYAAKLQAELNSLARPTRGGATRKTATVKKRKTPKKKTSDRVKAEDDSNLEDSGTEEKKVNRNSAFHKPYMLSTPLSELFDGETQLSRPQTVKRIWAYVRENGLQDQNDKRWLICDGRMRAVFKTDKVHMFTMNKILSKNLFPIDE